MSFLVKEQTVSSVMKRYVHRPHSEIKRKQSTKQNNAAAAIP